MVATVGSISVDLTSNVARFQKDFKSAATTVDREASKMGTSLGVVDKSMVAMGVSAASLGRSMLAGIAGGAVVGGLFSLTGAITRAKDAVKQFDDIADAAVATGLNNEFFQTINFGAVEAGVSMESLTGTLATFARNAGLAAEGKGRMTTALRALNPGLLEAINNTTSMEQKLKLVSNALAAETDASTRAAIGAATLGNGWRELLPVFDDGAAGLDQLRDRARELGVIIDEETLRSAGELEDQLNTLGHVISMNMSKTFVQLGPWLVRVSSGAADAAKNVNDLTIRWENFVAEVNRVPGGADMWDRFVGMMLDLDLGASRAAAAVERSRNSIGGLSEELAAAAPRLETLNREMEAIGDGLMRVAWDAQFKDEVVALTARVAELQTKLGTMGKAAAEAFGEFVGTAMDEVSDLTGALSGVLALVPGMSGIADALGGISSLTAGAPEVPEGATDAVDPMADLTKAASDALVSSQQGLAEAQFQASEPTSQEQMAWDANIEAAKSMQQLIDFAGQEDSAGGKGVTQAEIDAINKTTEAVYQNSIETQRVQEEMRAAAERTEASIAAQQSSFDAIGWDTQRMGDSLAGIDPRTGELVDLNYALVSQSLRCNEYLAGMNTLLERGLAQVVNAVAYAVSSGGTATSEGGGKVGYGSSVAENIQFMNDRLVSDMGPSLSGVVPANEVGGFYAEGGSWEFGGNQRGDQTPYTLMGNPGEVGMVFSDAQQRLLNTLETAVDQSSRGNGDRPIQVVINADSRTTGERVRMAAIEGVRQGVRQADAVKGRGRG